jgi:hypothetical protein
LENIMTMIIDTDNSIHLSMPGMGSPLKNTGLKVTQRRDGTVVYSANPGGLHYCEHPMPSARYSLAHDAPKPQHASPEISAKFPPSAGRAQFETDLRALILDMGWEGHGG